MKEERKVAEESGIYRQGRPFLQPLAVALVCLILVSLLLIMGFMNLKALEKTLNGYMENRGLTILKDVPQVAERYFHLLTQTNHAFFDSATGSPLTDEAFSMQESFIFELTELAQEMDLKLEENHLSHEQMISFLVREDLWLIAVLDKEGKITFETRPVPREILSVAGPMVEGTGGFRSTIFNRSEHKDRLGFISLGRRSGQGTLILALDDEGLRRRIYRFSLRRAMEEISGNPDIVYLTAVDPQGRVLGLPGQEVKGMPPEPAMENPPQGTKVVKIRRILSQTQTLLEFVAPIHMDDDDRGVMRLGLAAGIEEGLLKKNRASIFVSMGFMVLITLLAMWLLYKNQNRHLARMQEVERRLQQAERLSALGRLASGVAHEIRNPLNAISMAVQRLQKDNPHQLTRVIRDEITRLNQIIEDVLSVSRTRKPTFGPHNVTGLLEEIVLLMGEEFASKGITFKTQWDKSPLMVSMDIEKVKQALLNIINNAMESISGPGTITLSAGPTGKKRISIRISDTGIGLSDEEMRHIFDLEYTTKDKGLGLGLPLAYEMIRGHGGEIRVTSRPGQGSTFEILLPVDNP